MPELGFESVLELEVEVEFEVEVDDDAALEVLLFPAFAGGGTRHELVRARLMSAQGNAEQAFVRDFWAMVRCCEAGKLSAPAIAGARAR